MSVVLCILDGWGFSPESEFNAIHNAHTPNYDEILLNFPHSLLSASGVDVGLPDGQMGNSEVGHTTIGSGRIIYQDLLYASKALETTQESPKLLSFIQKITNKRCHIIGLLSDGGVHSHIEHITRLATYLEKNGITVLIHAFLDGRDTAPQSAMQFVNFEHKDKIVTLSGRYYAMDRDNNWDRTEKAYDAITSGKAENKFNTPQEALQFWYSLNITDEFIPPCIIGNYTGMKNEDSLFIANFRPDRIRQITSELIGKSHLFDNKIAFASVMGMSKYFEKLESLIPPRKITNTLSEVLSKAGMRQLKIAESEKYAHVSYFFNGGIEEPFEKEERILIKSRTVKNHADFPEMRAYEITESLITAINTKKFDLIVVNYANTDMVGHSGNMNAAIKSVEAVDDCLGRVMNCVLENNYQMIITADHGNAESMYNLTTSEVNTAHTTNLVPFILLSREIKQLKDGGLSNVAPTILELLKIQKPKEMSESLLYTNRE